MEAIAQQVSLRSKWKKVLKGKPTTNDLNNYLRDVQRHHRLHSEIKRQLA
ncbi:hypothetical protein [Rasiella sp. SM2506]